VLCCLEFPAQLLPPDATGFTNARITRDDQVDGDEGPP
jgi:hypothetical protein